MYDVDEMKEYQLYEWADEICADMENVVLRYDEDYDEYDIIIDGASVIQSADEGTVRSLITYSAWSGETVKKAVLEAQRVATNNQCTIEEAVQHIADGACPGGGEDYDEIGDF